MDCNSTKEFQSSCAPMEIFPVLVFSKVHYRAKVDEWWAKSWYLVRGILIVCFNSKPATEGQNYITEDFWNMCCLGPPQDEGFRGKKL